MKSIAKNMPKFKFADLTDEDRAEFEKGPSAEEEHLKMIHDFYAQYLRDKKKTDPRYQWIAYGYRCRYFKDSKFDKITRNGIKFIDNFNSFFQSQSKGIYISGPVGTGKSYLAAMIANEMADRGYIVYMNRINDAIEEFNDFNNRTFANMVNNRAFNLVILDDFGSSRESDYQLERLFNLIDSIYTAQIPLIVTTNIPISEIMAEMDIKKKRIYDRITQMCAYFPPITGDSKRIEEAKRAMGITKSMFDSNDED